MRAAKMASTPTPCRRGRNRASPRSRPSKNPRALLARRGVPCRGLPRRPHRHAGAAVGPHPCACRFRPSEGTTEAPTGATGDGGFRVVPELMSVVGCSGEEFASILKALGFRRERRRLDGGQRSSHERRARAEGETARAAEPAFDEIWRPGKRKNARRPPMPPSGKEQAGRRRRRAASRKRQRERRPQASRSAQGAPTHRRGLSPFAVLADVTRPLAARRPEGKLTRDACRRSGSTNGSGAQGLRARRGPQCARDGSKRGKVRDQCRAHAEGSRPVRPGDVVTGSAPGAAASASCASLARRQRRGSGHAWRGLLYGISSPWRRPGLGASGRSRDHGGPRPTKREPQAARRDQGR